MSSIKINQETEELFSNISPGLLSSIYNANLKLKGKKDKVFPVFANNNLIEFFKQGKLGTSDPSDETSLDLINILSLIKHGLITRGMLTSLMIIYVHVNKLQDQNDKTRIKFDSLIKKYLKPKDFNSDNFAYVEFLSFIGSNLVKNRDLTKAQISKMNDSNIKKQLKKESKLLNLLTKYHKEVTKISNKK